MVPLSPAIRSLIDSRKPGHSLPGGLYTRDDVFAADMEIFFRRNWIAIGLECDVPDLAARTVLCCGPAPFMAAARAIGVAAGVPQAAWLEESFDLAPVESTVDEAPAKTGFSATFSRQNRTITVGADQTLLSAARAQGVVLPSSCANGLCGTCRARLVRGQVAMAHNGGIRQREIDAGLILPCCARPLTDVVIER